MKNDITKSSLLTRNEAIRKFSIDVSTICDVDLYTRMTQGFEYGYDDCLSYIEQGKLDGFLEACGYKREAKTQEA